MTLEDAKKEIEDRMHAYWRGFKGWDEEHWHDQRGNPYYEGKSDGLEEASEILDKVEPSGNPKQLTLKELARELRKIFRFRRLYYGEMFYWGQPHTVLWISNEPLTLSIRDEGGEGCPCYIHEWEGEDIIETLAEEDLVFSLDLSEYINENGEIDFSRCIVEVSDDAE